jgi:Fic family protein
MTREAPDTRQSSKNMRIARRMRIPIRSFAAAARLSSTRWPCSTCVMAVVVQDHLITEELIKETHGILCNGVDVDGSPNAKYAGCYRSVNVYAGYPPTEFTKPKDISGAMRGMVRDLHLEIAIIEKTGEIDPFFLASKFCEKFVLIHPFLDGNGRMCRLILNSILLKYAGVVAVIGEHDQAREEYLEIAARAGRENMDGAELATSVLQKSDRSMRKLRGSLERVSSESGEE